MKKYSYIIYTCPRLKKDFKKTSNLKKPILFVVVFCDSDFLDQRLKKTVQNCISIQTRIAPFHGNFVCYGVFSYLSKKDPHTVGLNLEKSAIKGGCTVYLIG